MSGDRDGARDHGSLRDGIRAAPQIARQAWAESQWQVLSGAVAEKGLDTAFAGKSVAALMKAIADHSSFLWNLVVADVDRCAALLQAPPSASLDRVLRRLEQLPAAHHDLTQLARILRLARQEVALLVALADLGGLWDLDQVTEALTDFADRSVAYAIEALVRRAVAAGQMKPDTAASNCGVVVLSMGKGGGRELNYSSDIDLIAFFDPAGDALAEGVAAPPFYVRLVQSLSRLLQERTADGYVLRVDLRLRPDPGSTAVAIALPSAFHYYETVGQTWERAAFIKARPIGGEIALGERFLRDLAPFIWRKYFDFAAIADIHAMKRQIHVVRGHAAITVPGHDVKLGRGGIREIEFFAQTQQLIFGGRRPVLRAAQTRAALAALAADGWIDADARDDLTAAYRFLRTVEHRLQMMADQQTQRLPSEDEDLAGFARFCGYDDRESFSSALKSHLQTVERHYAQLFEQAAPSPAVPDARLVFTGVDLDPAALDALRDFGFERAEQAAELIRGWYFGRRPAMQSARARAVLTDLLPDLLQSFAEAGDPDTALATLDTVLGRTASAVELLTLLQGNAAVRVLFADVLGAAPQLATVVSQRPHVLDAAIDPGLIDHTGSSAGQRIRDSLAREPDPEAFLDRMRDVAAEELFLIGVRTLASGGDTTRAEHARAEVADALIGAALDRSRADFESEHGRLPGGACVVLGMGKLGSRELSAGSDLDLMIIYQCDADAGSSDGPRPLDPGRYYARLTQRLIASLTVPTRRGRLYEVDTRLRPSGRQGPVAVRFSAFIAYHQGAAETWEHMALTRARVVAGDASLATDIDRAVGEILSRSRDGAELRRSAAAMRSLVAREKGSAGLWDMKLSPGGLLDIEFVAQVLALAFGQQVPSIRQRHPVHIIQQAREAGVLAPENAEVLLRGHRLQATLAQTMRLMVDPRDGERGLTSGVLRRMCQAVGQPDADHLVVELTEVRQEVEAVCAALLDPSSER